MSRQLLFVLFFVCFCGYVAKCQQQDSTALATTSDSIPTKKIKKHSPTTAAWMSAVLPGLGQGYNKKYWKIPIVYAGFGATGYCIYHFHKEYSLYRNEYRNRLNNKTDLLNPSLADFENENIRSLKLLYQRDMEISIIVMVVWYLVNIVDAVVDAHLMDYNISDDLSLQFRPFNSCYNIKDKQFPVNLSLTLKF